MKIVRFCGHRVREAFTHAERLLQNQRFPRVMFFPSQGKEDGASNLRAYQIAQCLRKRGWRVTVVPKQLELAQRLRLMRLERPDIFFMQMARHPLNRPRLFPDVPCVFDIDDADFLDADCVESIKECCTESRAVIAGSRYVAKWCRDYNSNVSIIWTSTPAPKTMEMPAPRSRKPILVWAHSSPHRYPHEAEFVREIALQLSHRCAFEFRLYGCSNREWFDVYAKPLHARDVTVRAFPYMDYESFLTSLTEASVGLQPIAGQSPYSQGKSFGKILAYLASKVAVVASDAVDHPLFFRHGENGYLCSSLEEWVDCIARLLEDAETRQRIAEAGHKDFLRRLTTEEAGRRVDAVLRSVLDDEDPVRQEGRRTPTVDVR